jgi:translation elongation factor EF-1beta
LENQTQFAYGPLAFLPPLQQSFHSTIEEALEEDIDPSGLFLLNEVDREALKKKILRHLETFSQFTLADLIQEYPLAQGLAELITYLSIATEEGSTIIDDTVQEQIHWTTDHEVRKRVKVPRVIFSREPGPMSTSIEYSTLLVSLLKGILDREDSPDLWQSLMQYEGTVREYFSQIGLDLVMDDAEGLAYLRSQEQVEGEDNIPKLLSRRALSYPQSLLLALLRKKQIEHEASSSEERLILDKSLVQQMMEVFLGRRQ